VSREQSDHGGVRLVLVHHGAALPPEEDALQPLSSAGRARVDALAAEAARRGIEPAVIWHSGKLRARQTAEALWRACHPFADMKAVRGLQPTDGPRLAQEALADAVAEVLIVGHLPQLARLLSALTTGADVPAPFPLHGLVALERDRSGRWTERFRLEA
jgi:phosphohistidine phosphatase